MQHLGEGLVLSVMASEAKPSTVSQVNAVLKGWRDLMMALRVVMSFLRTATMTTL